MRLSDVGAVYADKWQMWLEDLSDEKLEMFKVDVQKEIAFKTFKLFNYFKI